MPVMVICPSYYAAYKEEKIKHFGIPDKRAYRRGDVQGNSTKDERAIFEDIAYGKDELIDIISVGFPLNKQSQSRITLTADAIKTNEIKYQNLGKCFEVDLAQFAEPLEYILVVLKLPGYVYVNMKGNFFNADSYSKVEVKLKQCMFIELTYELMHHISDGSCRNYQAESYDDCSERAAEDLIVNTYNCTLPYTNTGSKMSELISPPPKLVSIH